jgi:GT2 family glycosyltransferase
MYSEDADWCRRIRTAGYSVYHLPGPSIIHFQKQSSARTREFTYVRLYRSILMLGLRYMDPEQLLHLRRLVLIDMAFRRWIFPLLGLIRPSTAQAQHERLCATRKVAQIWRRLDPGWKPDPPPKAAASPTTASP